MRQFLLLAALLALVVITPAGAAPIVWDFSSHGVNVPLFAVPEVFTSGGFSIGAYAYIGTASATLFSKKGGGDEDGLGIYRKKWDKGTHSWVLDGDQEIQAGDFIQLNLMGLAGLSDFKLKIGSVQSGESYKIWGSNTLGVKGTSLGTGTLNNMFFDIPTALSYKYLSVTAPTGDVLVMAASAVDRRGEERVPEPGTMALAAPALGLLYWVRRRKSA